MCRRPAKKCYTAPRKQCEQVTRQECEEVTFISKSISKSISISACLYLVIHQVPVKEAQEVCVPVKQSKPRQECVMKPRQVTQYLVAAVLRTAE